MAQANNAGMALALLKRGAKADITDKAGEKPVHYAIGKTYEILKKQNR